MARVRSVCRLLQATWRRGTNIVWKAISHLSNSYVNASVVAEYHYKINDTIFRFTSWVLTTIAVNVAFRLTHSYIIEAWYYFLVFRLFAFLNWKLQSFKEWIGPTNFVPKSKLITVIQVIIYIVGGAFALWLATPSYGLQEIINRVAQSHGA